MPTQQVPIMTPIKGVVRAINREGQPAETCWDALNVLPYDRYGRKRLAQRGGLKKQFGQQMGNGGQFVQGMIEAPNIIYPPGALTAPIYTIASLPGFGGMTFTTPGTTGPYLYNGPTFATFTLQWQWNFIINYGITVVPTIPANPWSNTTESASVYLFIPTTSLGGAAVNNPSLIILIGAAGDLSGGGSIVTPATAISVKFYSGIPSSGLGSWTAGPSSVINVNPSAGAQTASQTAPCTLTIGTTGFCTMKLGTNATISFTVSTSLFPTLNVYQVEVDAYFGGTNIDSTTQTLSVTD